MELKHRAAQRLSITPLASKQTDEPLAGEVYTVPLQAVRVVLLRFGLACHGIIAWKAAADLWENGNMVYDRFPVIWALLLYGLSFALLFQAARRRPAEISLWLIGLLIPILFASYWYIDSVHQQFDHYLSAGDPWLYSEYAAHLTRLGENPYQHSMLNAFVIERMSFRLQTPLLDGGTVSRYSYPALAFLLHLPFQWLGISPMLVYPIFFLLTLLLLYRETPLIVRPVALLPLFLDPHYTAYAFGGVNDIVWVCFMLPMMLTWRNPKRRALWYGLACAVKQQPWFLAPFLLVRIWQEARGESAGVRLRQMAGFTLVSAGVFLLVNLPFMLDDLPAWLAGVFSPFLEPMILLAQGFSSLTMFGVMVLSKPFLTLLALAILGVGLILYWRHFDEWREAIWLIPAVSLWFNYRSLNSYWYFFAIPFFFALLRQLPEMLRPSVAAPVAKPPARRVSLALAAVIPLLIVVGVAWSAVSAPDIRISIQGAVESRLDRAIRMRVHVHNNSRETLTPRFSVQNSNSQPFFWHIEDGPEILEPAASALYTISTDIPGFSFDISRGAQVIVSDARNASLRASVLVQPDLGARFYDAIPNGDFRYWDIDIGTPARWGLLAEAGNIRLLALPDDERETLAVTVEAASAHEWSMVMLETWIPAPNAPVEVWVKPPAQANLPPSFDVIYGFELLSTWNEQRVWVLFGDEPAAGELPNGVPYWMIPAPRETWSLQTIDVRHIFETLGLELSAPRRVVRYDLPFNVSMMNFRLLAAARNQAEDTLTVEFGAVKSTALLADPAALVAQDRANPEWNLLWRAEMSFAARNYAAAREDYTAALLVNPDLPDAYMGLGRANLALKNWDAAINAFELALAKGYAPSVEGYNLIGQAQEAAGNFAAAYTAFRAAEAYLMSNAVVAADDEIATYLGLGRHFARVGECDTAYSYFERVLILDADNAGALHAMAECTTE